MSGQTKLLASLAGSFFELLAVVAIIVAIVLLIAGGTSNIGGVYYNSYDSATALLLIAIACSLQAIYLGRKF